MARKSHFERITGWALLAWLFSFGKIYIWVNEKNSSVADLWDGENLKCTFRRPLDEPLMLMWFEVEQLTSVVRKIRVCISLIV